MIQIIESTNTLSTNLFLFHGAICGCGKNLDLMILVQVRAQQTIKGSIIGRELCFSHVGIVITDHDEGFILFQFGK